MDIRQTLYFTLPVHKISYSVRGFGIICHCLVQICTEQQQQQKSTKPIRFQSSQDFLPKSLLNEIYAKTCMIYRPIPQDKQLVKENFNHIIVIEVELPSGMRINKCQIKSFLHCVKQVMFFTYDPCNQKLIIFINVPSTDLGKEICLEWGLERLSSVTAWSPIQVRAYDFLQQENQLLQLIPIDVE